jgi:hypothetical protein
LRFCFGMGWRRAALALNGMVGCRIRTEVAAAPHQFVVLLPTDCIAPHGR